MSNQNQLAVSQKNQVAFPSHQEWGQISQIATTAFKSGLLPSSIKSPEAATIVALKAWELGLPPMMAFSHIHVISGKPTLSAELMQTLVRKNIPHLLLNVIESSEKTCVIEIKRPEPGSVKLRYEFTIEMAEKAKLLVKDVWKQYPKAMLLSRCMSACLRAVCPDALLGVSYTPEELGADVGGVDGHAIETTSRPVGHDNKEELKVDAPSESKSAPETDPGKPEGHKPKTTMMEELKLLAQSYLVDFSQVTTFIKETFPEVVKPADLTQEHFEKIRDWLDHLAKQEAELPPWQQEMMGNPHELK